jgi:hypothetical protein
LTGVEALQLFQSAVMRELDKRARAIEERRKWYEETAAKVFHSANVKFVESLFDEVTGEPLNGMIGQINGKYIIKLKSNLPLEDEHFTYAHEIAHALLGHAKDGTPKEYEQGKIFKEVFLNGAMNKATGYNVKKLYQEVRNQQEAEADKLGWFLYGFLRKD